MSHYMVLVKELGSNDLAPAASVSPALSTPQEGSHTEVFEAIGVLPGGIRTPPGPRSPAASMSLQRRSGTTMTAPGFSADGAGSEESSRSIVSLEHKAHSFSKIC